MTTTRRAPNLFSISATAPFLATLADAIVSGRLIPGVAFDADPLALADTTIYLPTRRAARGLADALRARLGRAALILPAIRPIGDIDEEDILIDAEEASTDRLLLPAAVPVLERRLALARLIRGWTQRLAVADGAAPQIPLPQSPADAVRLADDLARLMDAVEIEGVGWAGLATLVPAELAAHWALTLDFLKIATERWPDYLAANGRSDPAARRNMLIEAETARLGAAPPQGPVIAAGSTGSVPATARLLAAIAGLDRGAVVLPGLDRHLDDESWAAISDGEPAFAHPQYGMKRLIEAMGASRDDVEELAPAEGAARLRAGLLSEAMRPAETTDRWSDVAQRLGDKARTEAVAGIALLEARNEAEEALAIALALREAIETPDAVAALVTPDRGLARRVAVELRRWDVALDDSAGQPLTAMPAAVLARLVAEVALSAAEPVAVLSLLKHPLCGLGQGRAETRRAAQALELALLRNGRPRPGTAGLRESLADVRAAISGKALRVARPVSRLGNADWEAAADILARLGRALAPLEALGTTRDELPLRELAAGHLGALLAVATEDAAAPGGLLAEDADAALLRLLEATGADDTGFAVGPGDYGAVFEALLAGHVVRRPRHEAPRVHIWGQLEARLQSVDLLVLAGLNEGVWPADTRTDPWLSRAMRRDMGLEPPERRIGLSAHDFAQGLGMPAVIVSRADRVGGAPSVPSRWLQRLLAVAGPAAAAAMRAAGKRHLDRARAIDRAAGPPRPAARPAPKPPLDRRPQKLSVTEIEKLVRDPYAIFARHVLGLDPLDPIGAEPDFSTRGTLYHEVLGRFATEWQGAFDATARARLLDIGAELFAPLAAFPETHALWWRRFERIAGWYVDWEAGRDAAVAARHAEIGGRLEISLADGPFALTGRADRIDELADGTLAILDFKTGTPPSARRVLAGFAPQLALEGAMARAGAFAGVAAGRSVSELKWVQISGRDPAGEEKPALDKKSGLSADEVIDAAFDQLVGLARAYRDPDRGYLSRARPMKAREAGDYDRLARVAEWTATDGEEGEP